MPKKKLNSINDLIIFALYSAKSGRKCSFEELVKECFNNFPQVFLLKNCPRWPDTRKLDRPLRSLRKKKLIAGDPSTFFSLTSQGKKEAQYVAKNLKQGKLF